MLTATASAPKQTRAEIRQEVLRCALSPLYFIERYCKIFDAVAQDWIPFTLWPAQIEVLRAVNEQRSFNIALKSRQVGLTWLGLAYNLWGMIFRPVWVGLMFSLRDNEAIYLLSQERLRGMYARLPDWLRAYAPITVENSHQFRLANQSIAYAFPTTAGDGYTATFVLVDEADLIPDLDRLMGKVKPTIDAGGRMLLISRPDKRKPGSLFKAMYRGARDGMNNYRAHFIPWHAHPGRDQAWYEAQKRDALVNAGSLDTVWEQYPATDEEALAANSKDKRFPGVWLRNVFERMLPRDVPGAPSVPGLIVFHPPRPKVKYVLGADPAEGNPNSDDSALEVLEVETGEQVAHLSGKFEPSTFGEYAVAIIRWYNNAPILPERNNHGHAFILALKQSGRARVLTASDGKPGYLTTPTSKALLIDRLADELKGQGVLIHHQKTFDQLASIEGSSLSAPSGEHDDAAMAFALASYARAKAAGAAYIGVWTT